MKSTVKREFGVEGYAQFLAVEHAHHLFTEVDHWRAVEGFLVKARRPNKDAGKALTQCGCCLRGDLQRLVRKAVSPCRFGLLVVGFWHLKIHLNDGFEGFSLTPPSVS